MKINRNIIKKFIRNNINEYDIGRVGDEWEIGIDDLYQLNDNMVDNSDNSFILWLLELINLINNKQLNNMDKEDMICFPISGFCWNHKREFVIFNER
jgi:hypothetical protein